MYVCAAVVNGWRERGSINSLDIQNGIAAGNVGIINGELSVNRVQFEVIKNKVKLCRMALSTNRRGNSTHRGCVLIIFFLFFDHELHAFMGN